MLEAMSRGCAEKVVRMSHSAIRWKVILKLFTPKIQWYIWLINWLMETCFWCWKLKLKCYFNWPLIQSLTHPVISLFTSALQMFFFYALRHPIIYNQTPVADSHLHCWWCFFTGHILTKCRIQDIVFLWSVDVIDLFSKTKIYSWWERLCDVRRCRGVWHSSMTKSWQRGTTAGRPASRTKWLATELQLPWTTAREPSPSRRWDRWTILFTSTPSPRASPGRCAWALESTKPSSTVESLLWKSEATDWRTAAPAVTLGQNHLRDHTGLSWILSNDFFHFLLWKRSKTVSL